MKLTFNSGRRLQKQNISIQCGEGAKKVKLPGIPIGIPGSFTPSG
jgi:hypothetical protein